MLKMLLLLADPACSDFSKYSSKHSKSDCPRENGCSIGVGVEDYAGAEAPAEVGVDYAGAEDPAEVGVDYAGAEAPAEVGVDYAGRRLARGSHG